MDKWFKTGAGIDHQFSAGQGKNLFFCTVRLQFKRIWTAVTKTLISMFNLFGTDEKHYVCHQTEPKVCKEVLETENIEEMKWSV